MPQGRRLKEDERSLIVREAAKGVAVKALAERLGVTTRTIQYTLKRDQERRRDTGVRTAGASVTVTPEEMQAFDAVLEREGIDSRSDGLRRLMQMAGGLFVPDQKLASELAGYRAEMNRAGNSVAQIAKRMNAAHRQGLSPDFSAETLEQIRGLARFILDNADEVDLLIRRRRARLQLTALEALKEFAHAAE